MDFVAAALLLILYFIRPQDWVPGLAGLNIVKPIIALGLLGLLSRRRAPAPSSNTLADISNVPKLGLSPHDIGMLAYITYIVVTAPDNVDTFKGIMPLASFYILTALAVNSADRLSRYLKYWTICVTAISAMAVGSKFGIDITQAADLTQRMEGRLVLNTWMHNNPNALGHTAITAIPLAYFCFFWKRPAALKLIAVLCAAVALYCVYLTQSKGAFLAGFVIVVASLLFGRPRWVQIVALVVAATSWSTVLTALPRMEQMQNLRSDEGVLGRLMAWELARTATRNHDTGEGWKQFEAYIDWEGEAIKKSTHSCYVRVGADLGYPGLFLYLLLLYFGVRSLVHYRGPTDDLERCRRLLFALVIAYLVSGWMIDRTYHTEYFLILAAIRAYHRLALAGHLREAEDEEAASPLIAPRAATVGFADGLGPGIAPGLSRAGINLPALPKVWNKVSILDLVVVVTGTWGVLYTWDYILQNL